ncbi:DNA-binding protein [Segatella copri]|uniref:DNA-binding protein n=1 Tax=Segatella copri TaxID=165179 RepID=A0AA92W4S9_9BACT|nr:DNA-binding protein [Segatella copri]RGW38897.1 DNA-binding protein [Segatella copri]
MILIKLAKNKNKTIKEAYGKYYARPVVTETIGIDELAEHMSSHNTPFSKGAIKGLLTDMVSCVKELVLQNKAVKIDNLAIFSIGIINKMGAASIKEWSLAKFVEGYRLRARATGKLSNTQLSLDANAKNAMDLLNSSESAAGDTTTGDTTQGGGTTEGGGTSQGDGTSQGGSTDGTGDSGDGLE